jgi:hypothetical protein
VTEQRRRVVVVVLALVAVALVFVASAVKSYLPLFFVWIPQLGIPVFLSRTDPRPVAPAPTPARTPATDTHPEPPPDA